MQVVRIGLDLAEYIFEVHGVDNHGKVVVRKRLRRDAVARFFANLPACLVGMEASNGRTIGLACSPNLAIRCG